MAKVYNITRESGAQILGISTRTVDRYIRSGKLSYKKIANKVLLEKGEIYELKKDFSALHQEVETEVVSQSSGTGLAKSNPQLEAMIEQKLEKFFLIFREKEKILEEKNKIIFVLQQRVGELETKIQNMIALPDYTREKQEAIIEKQKLEEKIFQLKTSIKNEKLINLILIALTLIFLIIAGFLFFK
ncbi:MAG: helix-turn-helix domain-containing protein [Candidatus Absconditabacteria bacterium]|nr:helix-turn-helix domain-containing protein [Candidatus Absconditabacteria bacterium]